MTDIQTKHVKQRSDDKVGLFNNANFIHHHYVPRKGIQSQIKDGLFLRTQFSEPCKCIPNKQPESTIVLGSTCEKVHAKTEYLSPYPVVEGKIPYVPNVKWQTLPWVEQHMSLNSFVGENSFPFILF